MGGSLDIGYLFSNPLIMRRGPLSSEKKTVPRLAIDTELDLFSALFARTGKSVRVRYDVATIKKLQEMIIRQCRVIHYTGHGLKNSLVFEDEVGEAYMVPLDRLRALVRTGSGMSQCRFVFVSACHSESAGAMFIEAGVPHVVCVKRDNRIKDKACAEFSRAFYFSLLHGETVREAFEAGKVAVEIDPNICNKNEASKFVLLPENDPHDERIFPSDYPVGSVIDASPKVAASVIPSIPEKFIGREEEVQELFRLLIEEKCRFISILGTRSIGKSACMKFLCSYMAERHVFSGGIHYINVSKLIRGSVRDNLVNISIGSLIYEEILEHTELFSHLSDPVELSDATFLSAMATISSPFLLVLDHADLLVEFHKRKGLENSLEVFLTDLLSVSRYTQVIISTPNPIEVVSDVDNRVFNIEPLSNLDAAKLFLQLCSNLVLEDLPDIPGTIVERLAESSVIAALRGLPGCIWKIASSSDFNGNLDEALLARIESLHLAREHVKSLSMYDSDFSDYNRRSSVPDQEEVAFRRATLQYSPRSKDLWIQLFGFDIAVPYDTFTAGISVYFESVLQTSRTMDQEELLVFIRECAKVSLNEDMITLDHFDGVLVDYLDEFVKALASVKSEWESQDPKIIYITGRISAENLLSTPGMFLIRPSSEKGCLVLSKYDGGVKVHTMINPKSMVYVDSANRSLECTTLSDYISHVQGALLLPCGTKRVQSPTTSQVPDSDDHRLWMVLFGETTSVHVSSFSPRVASYISKETRTSRILTHEEIAALFQDCAKVQLSSIITLSQFIGPVYSYLNQFIESVKCFAQEFDLLHPKLFYVVGRVESERLLTRNGMFIVRPSSISGHIVLSKRFQNELSHFKMDPKDIRLTYGNGSTVHCETLLEFLFKVDSITLLPEGPKNDLISEDNSSDEDGPD